MPTGRAAASCTTCDVANARRAPFRHGATPEPPSQPLQVVCADVCGPFPPSRDGCHYFVNFIDTATRASFIATVATKDGAADALQNFLRQVARFGRVGVIKSDGGGEFKGRFEQLCAVSGIAQRRTSAGSSNANAIAERHIRSISEMTRAMLLWAGLTDEYWSFAARFATYLRNRLPHAALPHGVTPLGLLHGGPPSLLHVRVFGCQCVYFDASVVSKAAPRGRRAVFLGIDPVVLGYIVLDPVTNKLVHTRSVTFYENKPGGPLLGGAVEGRVLRERTSTTEHCGVAVVAATRGVSTLRHFPAKNGDFGFFFQKCFCNATRQDQAHQRCPKCCAEYRDHYPHHRRQPCGCGKFPVTVTT